MSRPSRVIIAIAVYLTAICIHLIAATPAAQEKPQPFDNVQTRWKIDSVKGEANYIPDAKSLDTPTITMSCAALAESTITIAIQSDAKILRVGTQQQKMEFDFTGTEPHTLFLSLKTAGTTAYYDGKESIQQKGILAAIIARGEKSLPIQFVGANYVNIHYKVGTEAPSNIVDLNLKETPESLPSPRDNSTSAQRSPVVSSSRSERIKIWQHAVFQLRVKDASKNVFATGTGFLVSRDGLAVTNFHVIEGALNGTAVFDGTTKELQVELWAAQPSYDLAIVKIRFDNQADIPEPLRISENPPPIGEDVKAVGFSEFGFTVTGGIVSGERTFEKMPQAFKKNSRYATDSQWIQTDCTINHGNSGGPLITASGDVIGINTWCAVRDDNGDVLHNIYFALDILHANRLLKALPAKPLTFATAVQKFGGVEAPSGSFPHIIVARTLPSQEIATRMAALTSSIACPACHGTGKVLVTQQNGVRHEGIMDRPLVSQSQEVCPACGGTKYNSKVFTLQASAAVDAIARVNPDDRNFKKQLDDTGRRLWIMAELYPAAFSELNLAQNWTAQRKKNPIGMPLMLQGIYLESLSNGDENGPYVVQCGNVLYALNDLATVHATKGDRVVFGGLLAGGISLRDGNIVPVLEYGFLLSDDAKLNVNH